MKKLLLILTLCICPTAFADDAGVRPDTSPPLPSGEPGSVHGSAAEAPAVPATSSPADKVTNPAEHPLQAWDEAKAAKRTSWPLLVWTLLVMLGKSLAYGRDKLAGKPLLGPIAAWLAKGKGAMLVAGLGAVGVAGLAALVDGGSWVAAIVASGAAIGGILHSTTKETGHGPVVT